MDIRENISSVLSECIMYFVRIHDAFDRNESSVSARSAVCCKSENSMLWWQIYEVYLLF